MKLLISALFVFLTISSTHAGANMKIEGTCTGQLKNNTPVSFSYFSDFDGCKNKSNGAISFNGEDDKGLRTGERAFKNSQDLYNFDDVKLAFADSTGNTSGVLTYKDEEGKSQRVEVQCEIRDYEYGECLE